MNKLFASGAVLLAFSGTAFADDLDGDGYDDITGEAVLAPEEETTTTTSSGTDEPAAAPAAAGGEGPKMGISTSFNAVGSSPLLQLLYNLGGNYLDIFSGFSFTNTSPDMGDSETEIDFTLGAGYRMYKDMDGRIHPYLEPYLALNLVNNSSDAIEDPISITAGANLGVDFMVYDQFSLGAALGAGLGFTTADSGTVFSIATYTTSINATFWWGN